jgi:hypothetical protein
MKDGKVIKVLLCILLTFFLLYGYFKSRNDGNELHESGIIVVGKVEKRIPGGWRQSSRLTYSYKFADKDYEDDFVPRDGKYDIFINKRIPILVSKREPEINRVFVYASSFVEFGYVFPDSLKWIND